MKPLAHSHTNQLSGGGGLVRKSYQGPRADLRCRREVAALTAVYGQVPVPRFVDGGHREARFSFVAGVPAQEVLRPGTARRMLRSCGTVLRSIHAVDPSTVEPGSGPSLVHGDYGPNNLLVDPDTLAVVAVVDWEWAHGGDGLEDVAWCEWIVRMYSARCRDALAEFFDAYGSCPAWSERHQMMIEKCRAQLSFWEEWPGQTGKADFRRRQLHDTEHWTE
jgi:aminoglycoside phosphotransferase (APT) family kinase protein